MSDAGAAFVVAATQPIQVASASVVERKMMGEDEYAKKIIVLMYCIYVLQWNFAKKLLLCN